MISKYIDLINSKGLNLVHCLETDRLVQIEDDKPSYDELVKSNKEVQPSGWIGCKLFHTLEVIEGEPIHTSCGNKGCPFPKKVNAKNT